MVDAAIIAQLRERACAYDSGSAEREAYHIALIRREYAAEDARIDAALMRSWRLRGVYGS